MAATAMYMPHQQSQQGSFSPLTMFECTISSATMLIDSMAVRDLLVAFKIVAQLHGHLLEVLDPTVQRLASVADEHSMCPPPPAIPTNSGGTYGGSGLSSMTTSGGSVAVGPVLAGKRSPGGSDEDDCVLVEADVCQLLDSGGGLSGGPSPAKAPRLQAVAGGDPLYGGGGGSGGGELSNEWKATLRKAYRVLKDETATDVFDFSMPYSAGANVLAAQKVIERALTLCRQRPGNMAAWQSLAGAYVHRWFRCNLKPTAKRAECQLKISAAFSKIRSVSNKLNRRQRAYDAIKSELDDATRAKAEATALSRNYTSSDEECGLTSDLDADTSSSGQPPVPMLRVRALSWESEELRLLKRRLDAAFLDRLADDSQRAEAARLRREPSCCSIRQPPSDGQDWAKQS